jgi:hypothetical protein
VSQEVYTRKQYLDDYRYVEGGPSPSFRRYYGQFVTENTRRFVVDEIGSQRLADSTDPHFNDIPLPRWDRLARAMPYNHSVLVAAQGHGPTLSDLVCIAKEAARQ